MENFKQVVIPVTLKGVNYLLWARTTKIALCSRGLWPHIEGGSEVKTTEKDKEKEEAVATEGKWFQEDQMVLGIIQNSLEASILEAYSYCETSKELWDTLKHVYGNISNFTRVFEVKKALGALNQEDTDFNKHFGKFRSLWAELEMLRPSSVDPKVLNERREEDKVFGLLLTLSPIYNELIKHILRADKLPSLEEVCGQIQKEQGSVGLFSGKEELISANKGAYKEEPNIPNGGPYREEIVTANKGTYKVKDRRNLVCEHCKKDGHSKDKCWLLHPHLKPKWWKDTPRVNLASEGTQGENSNPRSSGSTSRHSEEIVMRKADLEALIQSITSKLNSGISLHSTKPTKLLVVDSRASHHMISNANLLDDIKPALGHVVIANGDKIPIEGIGNLNLFKGRTQAFYMPKFTSNLVSVRRTTNDLKCYAIFGPNEVCFQDIESGTLLGRGGIKDDLYVLEDTFPCSSQSALVSNASNKTVLPNENTALWHARLGHPHSRALELMLPSMTYDNSTCEACILGKHCKSVFSHSATTYEHCFDLIHSDVWTSPCSSRDNNKYFVTFIDEKSKYTWITLIPSKDRVFDAFRDFHNYVTNQFNAKVKIFRTDNGGEYTSHVLKTHLAKHGILHQTSCPYTPQQNGVAERKNRHLMEVARSMMFHHNVPRRFWGDAVMAACYLINRTPTRILKDQSPFEVLNNTKPFIDHLRVFGCVCFVLVPGELRTKLDAKSNKCIFLGYSTTQKGYKCLDPVSSRTYVSREVKFIEHKGYYETKDWEALKDLSHSTQDRAASLRFLINHLGDSSLTTGRTPSQAHPENGSEEQPDVQGEHVTQNVENGSEEQPYSSPASRMEEGVTAEGGEDSASSAPDSPVNVIPILRRSTWVRKRPVHFNAKVTAHPIQATYSVTNLPAEHQAFLGQIESHSIPATYEEAMEHQEWAEAITAEIGAMEKNHTWDEEELPHDKKCVSSKWVFTIKYKSSGEIERYKARLVARGFTQTYGDDYTDTFAPVAKQHTVKVILSLATNLDWELWQMDVKNAFLQGDLEEEVYMSPPPGLETTVYPGKVLRLRKAIYGLKQSPRAWYHKLSTTLKENGFHRSEADHTLFTLQNDRGIVVVLVYVDDLIISGSDKAGIKTIKSALHSTFDIKDLGELKYFLGVEVCRFKEGLFISQRKYILDLLSLTGKIGAKPAKTPLESGYKVPRKGVHKAQRYPDAAQYRRLVGKLIYLTYTRPDISFAVNQVSQHMQTPTMHHWNMVERILRYLKGSPGQGIWMSKNNNTEIVGYCDADWAGDRNDRKSTSGYCTFIGGNLATWKTKKQKVVSCSSAEAEYRAMRKLTDELVWLKALLNDLNIQQVHPITMHCDNQAAIHIATNPVFHERTKHIEVDCHKVRERIEEGVVLPYYTRSADQLADIFTKAASLQVCNHINRKLGLTDLTHA